MTLNIWKWIKLVYSRAYFSFFFVFEWFNASGLNGALEVVCIFIANDWKVDTKIIEFQG